MTGSSSSPTAGTCSAWFAAKVRAAMVSARARSLVAGVATLAFAAGPTACGGGKYGHAVTYAPPSAEETALAGAEPHDPVMAQRREVWHAKRVHLFGVGAPAGQGRRGRRPHRRRAPARVAEPLLAQGRRGHLPRDGERAGLRRRARRRQARGRGRRRPGRRLPGSLVRVVGAIGGTSTATTAPRSCGRRSSATSRAAPTSRGRAPRSRQ